MSAPEKAYIGIGMPGWVDEPHDLYRTEYTRSDLIPNLIAQARREALEEAAQVAEAIKDADAKAEASGDFDHMGGASACISEIRALIDKETRHE